MLYNSVFPVFPNLPSAPPNAPGASMMQAANKFTDEMESGQPHLRVDEALQQGLSFLGPLREEAVHLLSRVKKCGNVANKHLRPTPLNVANHSDLTQYVIPWTLPCWGEVAGETHTPPGGSLSLTEGPVPKL